MQSVELSDQEWQQVIAVLATGPWNVVNPILTKLAQQLQKPNGPAQPIRTKEPKAQTESKFS